MDARPKIMPSNSSVTSARESPNIDSILQLYQKYLFKDRQLGRERLYEGAEYQQHKRTPQREEARGRGELVWSRKRARNLRRYSNVTAFLLNYTISTMTNEDQWRSTLNSWQTLYLLLGYSTVPFAGPSLLASSSLEKPMTLRACINHKLNTGNV